MAEPQRIVLLVGTSAPDLFKQLPNAVRAYDSTVNIEVAGGTIGMFPNGESNTKVTTNMRGAHVFVCQTEGCAGTSSMLPAQGAATNTHLVEALALCNVAHLAAAARITVLAPNAFYARHDKKDTTHADIMAALVPRLFATAGAKHMVSVDLHAAQIQGFFDAGPYENLYAAAPLQAAVQAAIESSGRNRDEFILVAPDLGAEKRLAAWAKKLGLPYVVCGKQRDHNAVSKVDTLEVYTTAGFEATGKVAIVVDDMVDTAGTLTALAGALKTRGFATAWVVVTHGLFSGPAYARLVAELFFSRVICTDTVDQSLSRTALVRDGHNLLTEVSLVPLLAAAVTEIHKCGSVSKLFA